MAYNYTLYNPYLPMQPYQNQMAQTQMPPQQMPVQAAQTASVPTQGISTSSRPVTNREEALGTPADFSGAPMVFPDITHNRVYIKRWNIQTGNADFMEYVSPVTTTQTVEQSQKQDVIFASLQDFQDLQETVANLQEEINRLKKPAGKVAKKNGTDDE